MTEASTWLEGRVRDQLGLAGQQVETLREATGSAVLDLWNDLGITLANARALTSLLAAVHPDAAVRELAERLEIETVAFSDELMLDVAVHERLVAVPREGLDAAATRVLDDALRDFRRSGVDRDEETRGRLRTLQQRATELGQSFSRNIREGRLTTSLPAAALAGLPDDYRAEHPVDVDGRVEISTDYTDLHPFMAYAEDRDARRRVMATHLNLAWPANDAVLAELLEVRDQLARTLGHQDWPSYDAEVKMIGTGQAIADFIETLVTASAPASERDLAALREATGERPDVATARGDLLRLKQERFAVDPAEIRGYFDFGKVRDGLLEVTGRLFGVDYTPVELATWHADVSTYDVNLDGELLGRIHLDLHPREGKYNHAAQFDLVPGVRGRQLPEGVLVCNFTRGLMEHAEVVTLFHEFGHLLHHVLAGRHDWVRFSGVATEWDFVEAPSQLLEEWAWHPEVLRTFATDAAGEPIPVELVERMAAADALGTGMGTRTQLFYAALAYDFHHARPEDLTGRLLELYDAYSPLEPLPDTHFHCAFGHLEGYTSAYYTYLWSKVIAKDLWSAFDPSDPFEPETARRYRDTVLAAGGSRDAADLVSDFLGRPYTTDAFTAWLNRG